MDDYKSIFERIVADERYQQNLDWGAPRKGHPEGSIRAHIAELEANLETLRHKVSETDYWKLKLLIHTHDSFKAESEKGVAITHPRSHASRARHFLEAYCEDSDLLAMVQYHDAPYALWRQQRNTGHSSQKRMASLLAQIEDWNLFLAFVIIDGCTAGKSREPVQWLIRSVEGKVDTVFSEEDLI